jgi:nucleoside-diphosphate kinase
MFRSMDRTFIICKPDAVERGLVGEILARFERRNLSLAAVEMRTIDEATAKKHYAEHDGKPFFADLVSFITRGPAVLAVVEGPGDTWKVVRTMMGATNPKESAPGTIRGDLGILFTENLIHGSDSAESAAREISLFFPGR